METLAVVTEKDIDPNVIPTPESEYIAPRKSTRVVIFDNEGCVALGIAGPDDAKRYSMIGGGIDEGESIEDGLNREALEEAGCKIKNIKELGVIEERGIGNDKGGRCIQTNYCFIAEVDGEKEVPHHTEEDIRDGLDVVWLPLDVAIENLKKQTNTFVTRKALILLEEAKKVRG